MIPHVFDFSCLLLAATENADSAKLLAPWQVAIAVAMILVCGAISLALRLGLERRLFVASLRTVVQLVLIGFVLEWIFRAEDWHIILFVMLVMSLIAGLAAVQRNERRYRGIQLDSIISVWASSWIVTAVALGAIVQPDPWYKAQYAIPLLGMILGNTMNGIALGMDRLGEQLESGRDGVETLLALGATRWEAARQPIQQAVRTGMIPTLNTMMVVGLVSLPGMMTGQMLSGALPSNAVKYQIVIMFLIAAGAALGTVSVVLLGYRRLFNANHQFLSARLVKTKRG
jgi:putative ABC transport system permease protein